MRIFYYDLQRDLLNFCLTSPLTLHCIFLMLSLHEPIKFIKIFTLGIPVTFPDEVRYL
jgi:hypothetical protein